MLMGAFGLLALGLYLRLDSVTASLWIDEFGTFWVVEHGLMTALQRAWQFQGQSPLYYVLAWIPIHMFGESEVALRAPSLLLGCLFIGALYLCGKTLAGPRAGWYAAALGWFSAPFIRASVDARPYALVLFSAAMAVAGFQWAVRSESRPARILWILGGASVAWSHYVQYPLVVGLFVSYAMLPELRTKYRTSQFLADGLSQIGLVALCAPQVLALLARREALSWIGESHFVLFLTLAMAPLLPAIVLGEAVGRRDSDRVASVLERSLWISLLFHVGTLGLAALGGMNLLSLRYFLVILVPGSLLAAAALARLRRGEAVAALVGFAILAGGNLAVVKRLTGTFSGIGFEEWRGAVGELSERLRGVRDPLVLFRSGFVEEDAPPLGSPAAATLAPLRSPGRGPFAWQTRSLTYRWDNSRREQYFERTLLPEVRGSSRFFVLSSRVGVEPENYPDEFVQWVEEKCPAEFQAVRTTFGGVELLEFRRQAR